jgi:NAD-dependent dihydropyrimidine dehydrogenase PreA subunit
MTYVITESCVGTKNAACVATCPVDCIYEGPDQYYINPDECIGCGACEPACPVSAIYIADSLPAEFASYIEKNKAFFVGA